MTILTDAYVLRKSQRGDTDRQYVLYTQELGKITVLAKGAMKIGSKLAPHLDFFYLTEVMVAPGQAFFRLAGAKLKRAYLSGDVEPMKKYMACFFLEAADILMVEKNQDVEVFRIIGDFFETLAGAESVRQALPILNRSVFSLLSHLGYQPELKAKSQIQLTSDLHRQVMEAGEREVRSFASLLRELNGVE